MTTTTSAHCRLLIAWLAIVNAMTAWAVTELSAQVVTGSTPQAIQAAAKESSTDRGISPLDGCAWLEQDGIRAAWLGFKQVNDEMVKHLLASHVNTVFLKHGFHDLLEMETAHWDGDQLVVEPRSVTMNRMIENTQRAARSGIHVFWIANYELELMLPHLKRLGYQPAFAEGPSRYLRPGPHLDAAPLDRVFWRGITGAHGELVAKLSREHPIDGVLYDIEHYAGGIMYLQNSGFSDITFQTYLASREEEKSLDEVPAGTRYDFLKNSGRLQDYYHFLEESAYGQGRALATRWHAINPHLVTGIWPLLDNWFSQGFLRGLGGAAPSLGLSGVEYYHGSDQSQSMAEYFQLRNGNLIYLPGFYPPYAYSVDQLREHVGQAVRENKHYWMLGPHEELRQPQYQFALREAAESATPSVGDDDQAVNLQYRVAQDAAGPSLIIEAEGGSLQRTPRLSLWSTFGGAPLCHQLAMQRTEAGSYRTSISLLRRITNNRYLPDGFRSGANYHFNPVPREFQYEDPHHTKLTDGRAYGFFGTSVAWDKSIDQANVTFDLHREYRIVRVEVTQPTKMEDRIGGPTQLTLHIGQQPNGLDTMYPFEASFAVSGKDYSEPDTPSNDPNDPRHGRAWLSWRVDLPETPARWLRIDLERTRPNSSISLGEVVITALFDGELEAEVQLDRRNIPINQGRQWNVPLQPVAQVEGDMDPVQQAMQRVYQPIDLSLFHDSIKHWQMKDGRDRNDERYRPDQVVHIAENLLKFQNEDGGWPANLDWLAMIDVAEIHKLRNNTLGESTFDNRNVYPQIEYLARVYHVTNLPRYQQAATRGLRYILQEQRATGGWRGRDVDAITFNDDVMVGIMRLLLSIREDAPQFGWLDPELRSRLSQALDQAIDVTLKCQIQVDGKKTAWCQQHDHLTLKPVRARTYELPSITALESTGVVRFLMEVPNPSNDVIAAINSAIVWFEASKIEGLRIDTIPITPVRFETFTAKFDRREVDDRLAPPIWARFYEIETNRPFFCNRDGIKVYHLSEVKLERRAGYAWYGDWPVELLAEHYPTWKSRISSDVTP